MKSFPLLLPTLLLSFAASACSGRLDVGDDTRIVDPGTGASGTNPTSLSSTVALGTGHGCALLEDSTVACWGFNAAGQTGVSQADSTPGHDGQAFVALPRRVPSLSNVIQLTADWQTSCALVANGDVYCWGVKNALLPGLDAGASPPEVPILVPGLDHVVEIRSGGGPACARKSDGSVWCWGDNTYLNVGPTKTPQSQGSPMNEVLPPTRVPGISDATAIAVSDTVSCAVHGAAGEVSCWGRVEIDEDKYVADSDVPRLIPGVHGVKELALAQSAAIALLTDGSVMVWGGGGGDKGILTQVATPKDPHITDIDQQAVSPRAFTGTGDGMIAAVSAQYHSMCVLRVEGRVLCWGDNYGGEVGTGHSTDIPTYAPTPVDGVTPARGVVVGTWNSCARSFTGELVCWGSGGEGALGNGDPNPAFASKPGTPVLLPAPLRN